MSFINTTIETLNTPTDEKLIETIVKTLSAHSVYVGIPEEKASRKSDEMNNPTLLYIHSHGSELQNIPARPVIEPAIEDKENVSRLDKLFLNAALKGINGDEQGMLIQLGRIGMAAQNICRDWFTNPKNGWPPNQPATVKRKLRRLSKKKRAEALQAYESGESVDRPLIDTGTLRKAIVYVVK